MNLLSVAKSLGVSNNGIKATETLKGLYTKPLSSRYETESVEGIGGANNRKKGRCYCRTKSREGCEVQATPLPLYGRLILFCRVLFCVCTEVCRS